MTTDVIRSEGYLDPRFRRRFQTLATDHHVAKLGLRVFETWRTADRQQALYADGKTKARPGQSAHGFGLACDFALFDGTGWSWPDPDWEGWNTLGDRADMFGLEQPLAKWDPGHIQVPEWNAIRRTAWQLEMARWHRLSIGRIKQ